MTSFAIRLPEVDEWGVPLSKMPDCPQCGEDELGLIETDRAFCYQCNCVAVRMENRITEVPAVCRNCPWIGTIEQTEPGDDGELLCPQCSTEIEIKVLPTP